MRDTSINGRALLAAVLFLGGAACSPRGGTPQNNHPSPPTDNSTPTTPDTEPAASTEEEPSVPGNHDEKPPAAAEVAPTATPRLPEAVNVQELRRHVETWFDGHRGRRLYLQIDKPLYQPGETIWVKVWDLQVRNLSGGATPGLNLQLISPKGAVVATKQLQEASGGATNDIELPADTFGGEYTLRATTFDGVQGERPVVINTYEAPRIKKTLEFVRKAYGEGDDVTATIEVKRPTGEALANKALKAVVHLDGEDITTVDLTTNESGGGLVRFTLPGTINVGDGLLTVLVDDGGVTESISKRIPILMKKLQLAFFPEGGNLVEGLPSRVYFEAKTPIGKPADIEGKIVDDLGNAVATFKTYKNGLGRTSFTPATGRRYHAEVTRPAQVSEKFDLPIPNTEGCVLKTFDDPDSAVSAIRAEVRCTDDRKLVVASMLRENLLDVATVDASADEPVVVELEPKSGALSHAQGVARVTVFDEHLNPLAERVVFRNRRARLKVAVKPDRESYAPRDPVSLEVKTTDADGAPVPADLAVSVVDDTVVSFADDKTGHLLSRLLLEPELPGKIEEPNFYFDLTQAKSAVAMDLLMGTHGYRRFEWQPVLHPPPPPPAMPRSAMTGFFDEVEGFAKKEARAMDQRALRMHADMPPPAAAPAIPPPVAMAMPVAPEKGAEKKDLDAAQKLKANLGARDAKTIPMHQAAASPPPLQAANRIMEREEMGQVLGVPAEPAADVAFAGGAVAKRVAAPMGWAPVRVFPVPQYTPGESGPRTDFRETIYWAPSVRTGRDGKATVKFVASDAVTSFRIFTEGVGNGLAGRNEKVFKSNLPFSLSVKLPLEVSAGDRPRIPISLTNETNRTLDVTLDTSFGSLVEVRGEAERGGALAAGARRAVYVPLEVTGVRGESEISIGARTGGLSDEFKRTLTVTPLGFPQVISKSGEVKNRVVHELDLGDSLPQSVVATLKLYPSPVATLTSGLEGILREPSGCFEQTSSSNYPNVMVLQYLKEHDISDPTLLTRSTQLLDSGYHRLSGFESPHKGYEWFGGDPGHEALTAYGLLEFADMKQVYPDVDSAMVVRTANWLKSRRDGEGGYLRDAKMIDSFGRASPVVTNAYITYSLVTAGEEGLDREIEAQARLATETSDPYLLALATNTLLRAHGHHEAGLAAARRLAAKQATTGEWTGADHSITRSGGVNLEIETTSLALLALMQAGGYDTQVRSGITWLTDHRGGFGQWGATQATVLALKAMTTYANQSRRTQAPGSVKVLVNGEPAGDLAYDAGRRDPIVFTDIGTKFHPGENRIEIVHDGEALPYSLAVEYRTLKPATSPKAAIALETSLEKTTLGMGQTVRLNAVITNKTDAGQPMTMARIGLPAGLTFQTWQLKELREKGLVAFYETRPREVILYFRDMKPSEVKRIPIDLVAIVPGTYTGPASSAYLYYTDEYKYWTDGLAVEIKE
jgi:hypothetical protein